ncbi:MAG: phosphatidate cytidylyltransferase [Ideonella sp.]|jgi:phosphatidate cytidylyltransferase|nr:phosphatidate cytidylyltransferase [Ideonella sp.]MBL0148956.1 phosphatidate cytidylyltransferase [Ideonella sp.]
MLGQRIVTAIVLLALLLPALFAANPLPFQMLTLAMIGAAGWEWARLNGFVGKAVAMGCGLALGLACWLATGLVTQSQALAPLWWLALGGWVIGGAAALRMGPVGWPRLPSYLRLLLGLLLLWLAWLAMARGRAIGVNFLLSIMCIVWTADIAAYFGGRAFGRRKLAPTISPGKSWEGVYSGALGVFALAFAWMAMERHWPDASPSVFAVLHQRWGLLGLLVCLPGLTALSVVGDLFESLVKRAAGAKDSSQLLPGHGGVLDRVDALLPVLPVAMALTQW